MQLLPTNDQHGLSVWGASAKIDSTLSINEHFFKSSNTGGFCAMSAGLWSRIMEILQSESFFFNHILLPYLKNTAHLYETEKKKEEKRENVRC